MPKELLPEKILDDAVAFALDEVYISELEAATPKRTRQTSKQWKLRRLSSLKYQIYNDAQTDNGKYSIIWMLEEGTKPHIIKPRAKMALRWERGSKEIFAKKVQHTGFEGRFFVKQTLQRKDLERRFEKFMQFKIKQSLKL